MRRWVAAALSVLLVVGVLARGHLFQSLGFVALACEHPGESAEEERREHGGAAGEDDCPPNCPRCPCGQMPVLASAPEALPYILLEPFVIAVSPPPEMPGRSLPQRLDRPPRSPRA